MGIVPCRHLGKTEIAIESPNSGLYAPNGFGDYNGTAFNAETGKALNSYVADNPPVIAKNNGYFLQNGILYDINLSNNSVAWGFAGDGDLVTSPIVINQYVIVGSASGNLYALDGTTRQQVRNVNTDATIPPGAGWALTFLCRDYPPAADR